MLEPVRPEAVLPDRALCLPTFSHFLIVNKTSLSPASPRRHEQCPRAAARGQGKQRRRRARPVQRRGACAGRAKLAGPTVPTKAAPAGLSLSLSLSACPPPPFPLLPSPLSLLPPSPFPPSLFSHLFSSSSLSCSPPLFSFIPPTSSLSLPLPPSPSLSLPLPPSPSLSLPPSLSPPFRPPSPSLFSIFSSLAPPFPLLFFSLSSLASKWV
jgi:hypothetical protein